MQEKVYQYLLIAALIFATITLAIAVQKTHDLRGQVDSVHDQLNVLSWQYNEDKQWLEENKAKLGKVTHFIPGDDILVHAEVGR